MNKCIFLSTIFPIVEYFLWCLRLIICMLICSLGKLWYITFANNLWNLLEQLWKETMHFRTGAACLRVCHERSGSILCSWSVHRGGGKLKVEVGNLNGLRFCVRRGNLYFTLKAMREGFILFLKSFYWV